MADKRYIFGYTYSNATYGVLKQDDNAKELIVEKVGTKIVRTIKHEWLVDKLESMEADLVSEVGDDT